MPMPAGESQRYIFLSADKRRLYRLLCTLLTAFCVAAAVKCSAMILLVPPLIVAASWMAVVISAGFTLLFFGAAVPDERCAFCNQPRSAVGFLVAAPATSICDDCTRLSMRVLVSEFEARNDVAGLYDLLYQALPMYTPCSLSEAFINAYIDRAPSDASHLRRGGTMALHLHNYALAINVIERIPKNERNAQDLLNLGVAHGRRHHFADAISSTEAALSVDNGELRAWCLNNRAWFYARERADDIKDRVDALIDDVIEARQLFQQQQPDNMTTMLGFCTGTEAELRARKGDPMAARKLLLDLNATAPLTGEQWLMLARFELELNNRAAATAALKQATEKLHPETEDAEEAIATLARLGEPS